MATSPPAVPGRVRLPGLDPNATYEVARLGPEPAYGSLRAGRRPRAGVRGGARRGRLRAAHVAARVRARARTASHLGHWEHRRSHFGSHPVRTARCGGQPCRLPVELSM
ncbi:MAG: hypothetical protein ACR2GM_13020 [Nocardioidaceae bacterium]